LGLTRPTSQTPREFVRQLDGAALPAEQRAIVEAVAELVVEAFYRVRFGSAVLAEEELLTLEAALVRLEQLRPSEPAAVV